MVNRLKSVSEENWTGGINLRPETYQLAENELVELLNLEPDARGGLRTRRGWTIYNATPITADAWDPRNAFLHARSDGEQWIYVVNKTGGKLFATQGITFAQVATAVGAAVPHGMDFASWGDLVYAACGRTQQAVTLNRNVATLRVASGGANWQNDYTAPGTADNCPQAEVIAQHAGYLFVANTREATTNHPNRVRWSHSGNPKAWAESDFIDLFEGGSYITAMVPFSDRLLIFKPGSVWALFGYSPETWELTNISRSVGCVHQQAIVRSEQACFFVSWPQGIFAYTERGNVQDVSMAIRPVFSPIFTTDAAVTEIWLGWMGRRLWASIPFKEGEVVLTPQTVFVLDPDVGDGAWMMFRGADGMAPGPYLERTQGGQDAPLLGFDRTAAHALILDDNTDALDPDGGFDTRVRTRWIDAGAPTWKKSWRRPDFLMRGVQVPTILNVSVFHDFDFNNAQRQFQVIFDPAPAGALYSQFQWGDGTLYGGANQTSAVERGSTMGRSGAIQLLAVGERAKPWGLNGVIVKWIPRRFR